MGAALLVSAVAVVVAGCGGSDAAPSFTTVAVTSTAYVTIPARTTTSTMPRDPDDASAAVIEPAVANDPSRQRTYAIRAGDTLVGIGRTFDVPVDNLVSYNGWTDGLDHALVPGDRMLIPPSDYDPNAASADANTDGSTADTCPDGEIQQTYTVRAGDFPARVARDNDTTVDELAAANAGVEGYSSFVVGIEINIPC